MTTRWKVTHNTSRSQGETDIKWVSWSKERWCWSSSEVSVRISREQNSKWSLAMSALDQPLISQLEIRNKDPGKLLQKNIQYWINLMAFGDSSQHNLWWITVLRSHKLSFEIYRKGFKGTSNSPEGIHNSFFKSSLEQFKHFPWSSKLNTSNQIIEDPLMITLFLEWHFHKDLI